MKTAHYVPETAVLTELSEEPDFAEKPPPYGQQEPRFTCGESPASAEPKVREQYSSPVAIWVVSFAKTSPYPLVA